MPIPISTTVVSPDPAGGLSIDGFAPDRIVLDGALGINDILYYVTINGVTRSLASGGGLGLPNGLFTDGTGNLYGASFSGEGRSFAVVGYNPGTGSGGQFVGGYIRGVSGAPTSGQAQYRGFYDGFMADATSPVAITGSASIDANFDAGTFAGLLDRRTLDAGATAFNSGIVEADVAFGGTIDGLGRLRGGHLDADSLGSLTGQAHPDGVVGVVELTHQGGGSATSAVSDVTEVGTFWAE